MNRPSRRPWRWRRLTQFRIRTLLILTTVVAMLCAWIWRPEQHERPLVGGAMTIREEVRMVVDEETGRTSYVNIGAWKLLDRAGQVRIAGNLRSRTLSQSLLLWANTDGVHSDLIPYGRWTIYYPNGRKAVRGKYVDGQPVGRWRAWSDDGQLQAKYAYGQRTQNIETAEGTIEIGHSFRQGPVKVWWPNGQLRFVGQYADDHRSGEWTFYDPQGRKTASGTFRRDFRHGRWTLWDGSDRLPRQVMYVSGQLIDDPATAADRWRKQLLEGELVEQLQAAAQLERLGFVATAALRECLRSGDDRSRQLAQRALDRIESALSPP